MASVWEELKRRNVVKVAVAYAIVGWLLVQVADVAFPALLLPEWILRAFIILLVLGFPITLVMAWAYEMTPEGIKAASDVEPSDRITPPKGQRLNYVILGLVVLAVGFLIVDQYVLAPSASVAGSTISTPTVAGPASSSVPSSAQV